MTLNCVRLPVQGHACDGDHLLIIRVLEQQAPHPVVPERAEQRFVLRARCALQQLSKQQGRARIGGHVLRARACIDEPVAGCEPRRACYPAGSFAALTLRTLRA